MLCWNVASIKKGECLSEAVVSNLNRLADEDSEEDEAEHEFLGVITADEDDC